MVYTFTLVMMSNTTRDIIIHRVNCANAESAVYIATAIYDDYTVVEIEQCDIAEYDGE